MHNTLSPCIWRLVLRAFETFRKQFVIFIIEEMSDPLSYSSPRTVIWSFPVNLQSSEPTCISPRIKMYLTLSFMSMPSATTSFPPDSMVMESRGGGEVSRRKESPSCMTRLSPSFGSWFNKIQFSEYSIMGYCHFLSISILKKFEVLTHLCYKKILI